MGDSATISSSTWRAIDRSHTSGAPSLPGGRSWPSAEKAAAGGSVASESRSCGLRSHRSCAGNSAC